MLILTINYHKLIIFYLLGMNTDKIIETLEQKLLLQRYTPNTIKAYKDYAKIFLSTVSEHNTLENVPISCIEEFINHKVLVDSISPSYQKGLVGAIKIFTN